MLSTIRRRRGKAVHCHKEFLWFSSCIIDVPMRIRLTTTTFNGKTRIKTDFISNINETILFALNPNQIDGWYCVSFLGTHIRSLSNLTDSFSDRMQIFFAPPNDCFSNWNGFVIIDNFISQTPTLTPTQTHTHTLIGITHREPKRIACSAYPLLILFFVERKKICLLKDSDETACMCGEKSPWSSRRMVHYVDCEQWVFSRWQ